MKLRDEQQKAVDWLRTRRRACIVAPAGSGKTIIAAGALAAVIEAKQRITPPRIGWLANTLEQCEQARKALAAFEATATLEVKIACAAAATDWGDRDVLVVDEAHHSLAPQWGAQIATCRGAVWGFTATPPEDEEAFGGIFPELYEIDRDKVADTLAPALVRMLDASDDVRGEIDYEIEKNMKWRSRYWHPSEQARLRRLADQGDRAAAERLDQLMGQLWGQVAWQACIDIGIVCNGDRNRKVLEVARKHNEPTLILVNQVEHAQWIAEQLPAARACFSKMGKKKRAAVLKEFEEGTVRRIVATSLADEGLDLPCAAVLILVSAGRSESKTIQRTGRVLRKFNGKGRAIIYDFVDKQHPLMAKHSVRRQSIYRDLGYDFDGGTLL